MALTEHERFRFEKPVKAFIEARRPPPHIRPELDLGYRFVNQSVEIFEIRPAYLRPGELMENAVAKATYVKSKNIWKIYWMRADLQWHQYEPLATVPKVEDFIAEVDRDPYACFFG